MTKKIDDELDNVFEWDNSIDNQIKEEKRSDKQLDSLAKKAQADFIGKPGNRIDLDDYLPLPTLYDLFNSSIEVLKPPPREPVSTTLQRILRVQQQNAASIPFRLDTEAAYMREAVDLLNSRDYDEIVFMGCARTGKTQALVVGFAAYAMYTARDIMVLLMDNQKANEWAKKEFRPAVRLSETLSDMLTGREEDTNILTYRFKRGNWLLIRNPTVSNLASTTVQYVAITDYDRWDTDVGGEGSGWILAKTRTTTYSFDGMALVESSPGYEVINTNQVLEPHDSFECEGIASLYNLGDRRCFYFHCLNCKEWFWATPDTIYWDKDLPTIDAQAKSSRVMCPHCKHKHTDQERLLHLIPNGKWLKKGQKIDKEGNITGEGLETRTASFWLRAPACGYNPLHKIVESYLKALETYRRTGADKELQAVINTTFGDPYVSESNLDLDFLIKSKAEAKSVLPLGVAPEDTVLCMASVDVQNGIGSHFVVQIFAITRDKRIHLVDRFSITEWRGESVVPSVSPSHWEALEHLVMDYRLKIDKHEEVLLRPHIVLCDSGGEGDTTQNAYKFYQTMVQRGKGKRIFLVKGVSTAFSKVAEYSKSTNKNTYAYKMGIPLFKIDVSIFKGWFFNMLARPATDPFSISFNDGLPQEVFRELASETKNAKGVYVKKNEYANNEALDLFVYALAYINYFKVDNLLDKANPPDWLRLSYEGNANAINATNDQLVSEQQPLSKEETQGAKVVKSVKNLKASFIKSGM
ncbi:terminase gpA endonuclease subunit [Psittacicella hinzii]|nr:terminase gpA endonuclease subunit [Psittacicella hinzii]